MGLTFEFVGAMDGEMVELGWKGLCLEELIFCFCLLH